MDIKFIRRKIEHKVGGKKIKDQSTFEVYFCDEEEGFRIKSPEVSSVSEERFTKIVDIRENLTSQLEDFLVVLGDFYISCKSIGGDNELLNDFFENDKEVFCEFGKIQGKLSSGALMKYLLRGTEFSNEKKIKKFVVFMNLANQNIPSNFLNIFNDAMSLQNDNMLFNFDIVFSDGLTESSFLYLWI